MYKLSKYLIVCIGFLFATKNSYAQFKLPHVQLIAKAIYATPTNSSFKHNYKSGIGAEDGAGFGLGSTILMGTLFLKT